MLMYSLRNASQLLKVLAEENRLRILNLLHKREMNVAELCEIIGSTQSNISKHLAKLRLTGFVADRRDEQYIYYRLSTPSSGFHRDLVDCIIQGLSQSEIFEADSDALETLDTTNTSEQRY